MSAGWNLICCHENHPALLIYTLEACFRGIWNYSNILIKMSLFYLIKIVNTVYHGFDIQIEQGLSNVVTVKTYENIVFERFEFILVSSRMNTEYHGLSIKM